ncbi:hypothetical protein DPMN_059735 [Dreissena polymorpha]|uniref:Uncharacterized protein n=1 Tax=Dreissena polymorpha TaxID=45954 RepID=A0A9D4C4P4_DREPO|nr:hypothetical protein DPMN_059735 [Dreissena polymorpha]
MLSSDRIYPRQFPRRYPEIPFSIGEHPLINPVIPCVIGSTSAATQSSSFLSRTTSDAT